MPLKDIEARRAYDRARYIANPKRKEGQRNYRAKNANKAAARSELWRRANPLARLAYRTRQGLPPELGFCYACGVAKSVSTVRRGSKLVEMSSLFVDHCHTLGVNRGWLCRSCNLIEGIFAKVQQGPLALLPEHLNIYLNRFCCGWNIGHGLSELMESLGIVEGPGLQ